MPAMRGTGYLCSIAGKPAPTRGVATFQHTANLWEPGLPAMRATGYLCSIAGKPAPTVGVAVHTTVQHTAPTGEWQLFRSQQICRSLACQRCGGPGACVQSLASQLPQGEWQCTPLFSTQLPQGSGNFSDDSTSVGAGLPAMRGTGCLCSIAGKPAPTGERQLFSTQQICGSLACQR